MCFTLNGNLICSYDFLECIDGSVIRIIKHNRPKQTQARCGIGEGICSVEMICEYLHEERMMAL